MSRHKIIHSNAKVNPKYFGYAINDVSKIQAASALGLSLEELMSFQVLHSKEQYIVTGWLQNGYKVSVIYDLGGCDEAHSCS